MTKSRCADAANAAADRNDSLAPPEVWVASDGSIISCTEKVKVLEDKYHCAGYTDGKQFLADPEIELVSIAVRSTEHVDYALKALKAGKIVFLEKPFALTPKGMEKLEENQMVNTGYTNDIESAAMNTTNYNDTVSTNLLVINGETYIEQDTEKVDIRIEITAKHFVYIRYFIDSNRPATTNLLSGKTLYLEAKDVVMLTIGNAGEVVVKVNGKIINVGAAGETVNKTIKWVKNLNDSTRYNLIMSDTK